MPSLVDLDVVIQLAHALKAQEITLEEADAALAVYVVEVDE